MYCVVRLCIFNNILRISSMSHSDTRTHISIKSHCIVQTMALFVFQCVYVCCSFSLLPFLTRKNSKCERALAQTLMYTHVHIKWMHYSVWKFRYLKPQSVTKNSEYSLAHKETAIKVGEKQHDRWWRNKRTMSEWDDKEWSVCVWVKKIHVIKKENTE